jgi:predicted RNA-binding Zn-ribbon protein involved in translation (DUF1610 family)
MIKGISAQSPEEARESVVILDTVIASLITLLDTFFNSKPCAVVEYEDENFKLKVLNSIDIKVAFKKHAVAFLTDICPDCGKSMSIHNHEDDPKTSGVTNEPLN